MNETISKSEMKQNKIKLDENLNHWKYSRMNKQYDKHMKHVKLDKEIEEILFNPLTMQKFITH